MTLTLSIQGGPAPDAAISPELVLDRRGTVAGRAKSCDWALPDPTRHVSSRHFEIRFDGHDYLLIDLSTNGTLLARTGERLNGPHRIADGDAFVVGPYTIGARLAGAGADARNAGPGAAPTWRGWDDGSANHERTTGTGWRTPPSRSGGGGWDDSPAPHDSAGGWDTPLPNVAGSDSGWQPQTGPALARADPHRAAAGWNGRYADGEPAQSGNAGWAPNAAAPAPPLASAWDTAAPPSETASGWSSAAPDRPPSPSPDDLWGRIAEGNVVDWARGGFGQPIEARGDQLGLSSLRDERPPPAAVPTGPPPSPRSGEDGFLAALALDPARIGDRATAAARAGVVFRRLIAGMVVMLEARARAKAQLGAEATAFSPDGHNPLKFSRTPDEAIAMLVGPPQPGFMPSEQAIEDAFEDLQSHQVATLRAMQGALRATLERFSPSAIRARAKSNGVLERIVPAARDAALWQAYEREFGGVAQGSDEAFLDMFAKEFREAYNDQMRTKRSS